MSWTYDPTQLLDNPLYQVRNYIGDIDEDDILMQDEEILFELSQVENDVLRAAINCCERISARYMKQVDFKLGPYSIDLSRRAYMYKSLAASLKEKLIGFNTPSWTGSRPPVFDVGMMNGHTEKGV